MNLSKQILHALTDLPQQPRQIAEATGSKVTIVNKWLARWERVGLAKEMEGCWTVGEHKPRVLLPEEHAALMLHAMGIQEILEK